MIMNIKKLLNIGVFLVVLYVPVESAFSASIIRVSDFGDGTCSVANFQSAYNAASVGDTIQLPVGTNTWATGIIISKAVNIIGMGKNQTKLIADSSLSTSLLRITGFSYSDVLRISGICFDLGPVPRDPKYAILISNVTLDNLRIDHCEFHYGFQQLQIEGSKGVIDNNYFYNPLKAISFSAGSSIQASNSWNDMAMGTGNALFIEDNHFIDDANYNQSYSQERIGTYNGGKLVIRYNTFDSTNYPNTTTIDPIQTHGSAAGGIIKGYWQLGTGARRGQSTVEIYNNIMTGKRIDFMATLRGSANLIFSNKAISAKYAPTIDMFEEEQDQYPQWDPSRTAWPAEDQIHNSFIWGNTLICNGITNLNPVQIHPSSTNFIQENRDYWLHAPQSTGGREYFTGANGASSSYPTDGNTYPTLGTMVFTNGGPNAYYGYVPYTYPHPLTSLTNLASTLYVPPPASVPSAPRNLTFAVVTNITPVATTNLWISQTQNDSYWDTTAGLLSQSIDGSTPKVINGIDLLIYSFTNPQTVTVDIRTASNGGGSSLGSCARSVSTGGDSEWVRFDMPNVAITGTVYVTLTASGVVRWRIAGAGGTMYGGTTYCVYSGVNAVASQDFCFKIYAK